MCGVHTAEWRRERVLRIRINIRGRAEGGAARNRLRVPRVDKGNELRRICFSVVLATRFFRLTSRHRCRRRSRLPFSPFMKKLLGFIGHDPPET